MLRVASSTEGKVDRTIIKNLLVNYFGIPPRQQPQVLKIIATVLDFNYEERVKVTGLEMSSTGGWMSNWLGQKPAQMTGAKQRSSTNPVPSLSAAFIQFLETESRPTYTMKLPAESMAREITRKTEQKTTNPINPFALPPATSQINFKKASETDSSHLLMKPMTSTLPIFTPLPVSSASPSFLRDVLKDE
uniref:GRIP domain-containing protein n=1 Tax=Strigamia maritima TaxID=126957 RepID=T1JIC8_STRMM